MTKIKQVRNRWQTNISMKHCIDLRKITLINITSILVMQIPLKTQLTYVFVESIHENRSLMNLSIY